MSLLCYHYFFCPCWEHVTSTCFYFVCIWWKSQTVMWVRKCHNWKCQFFGWTISFKGKRTFFFFLSLDSSPKNVLVRYVSKILNPATFDFFTLSVNKRIQLSGIHWSPSRVCLRMRLLHFYSSLFYLETPPKKEAKKTSEDVSIQPLDQIQALVWMNSMLALPEQSAAVHRLTCSVCLPQYRQHFGGEASSRPAFISVNSQNTVLLGSSFLLTCF